MDVKQQEARQSDGVRTDKWEGDPLAESAPLGAQLSFMHDAIGLSDREFAFVAGVSPSTARRWRLSGQGERPMAIDDLCAIVRELRHGEAFSPKLIGGWLRSRNRGLGMDRPLDALRNGNFAEVFRVAQAAISGVAPPDSVAPRVTEGAGAQAMNESNKHA